MGISMPSLRAAAQMTEPFGTLTGRPSIVRLTSSSRGCSAIMRSIRMYFTAEDVEDAEDAEFRGEESRGGGHMTNSSPLALSYLSYLLSLTSLFSSSALSASSVVNSSALAARRGSHGRGRGAGTRRGTA